MKLRSKFELKKGAPLPPIEMLQSKYYKNQPILKSTTIMGNMTQRNHLFNRKRLDLGEGEEDDDEIDKYFIHQWSITIKTLNLIKNKKPSIIFFNLKSNK